jgi:hypothetical protein
VDRSVIIVTENETVGIWKKTHLIGFVTTVFNSLLKEGALVGIEIGRNSYAYVGNAIYSIHVGKIDEVANDLRTHIKWEYMLLKTSNPERRLSIHIIDLATPILLKTKNQIRVIPLTNQILGQKHNRFLSTEINIPSLTTNTLKSFLYSTADGMRVYLSLEYTGHDLSPILEKARQQDAPKSIPRLIGDPFFILKRIRKHVIIEFPRNAQLGFMSSLFCEEESCVTVNDECSFLGCSHSLRR